MNHPFFTVYYQTPLGEFFEMVDWISTVSELEEFIAKMSSGEVPFRKIKQPGRVHFLSKHVLMTSIISYQRQ